MKVKTLKLLQNSMVSVEKEGKSWKATLWLKYKKDSYFPVLEVRNKEALDYLDLRLKTAVLRLLREVGI